MPADPPPPAKPLAPLSPRSLHLCIDMQRLFAEPTAWHTPALAEILPRVARLAGARPAQTVFARFIPARDAASAPGSWGRYYARWAAVTGERLDPRLLDLVAPLAALAEAARIIDKTTYSAFGSPAFVDLIAHQAIDTLVVTGVETDVCVLASLFDAVDRGLRVVVCTDAVASGSMAAHAAVLAHVLPRLDQQIDIATVDEVLAAWTS